MFFHGTGIFSYMNGLNLYNLWFLLGGGGFKYVFVYPETLGNPKSEEMIQFDKHFF